MCESFPHLQSPDFCSCIHTEVTEREKGLRSWNISEALEAGFCQEEELCLGGSGPAPPTLRRAVDSCAQGSFSSKGGAHESNGGRKGRKDVQNGR